ncbi:MAG: chemotaxis protein CheW [Xenococcus sp. (in: cyanobacteria)]
MQEYFCIGLSHSVYLGLSLEHVDKLITLRRKDICLIPGIADFWVGVVNYKSSLLWILDLENFLGITKNNQEFKSQQTVLILNYSTGNYQKKVALIIKDLQGVFKFQKEQIVVNYSAIFSRLQDICDSFMHQDGKDIALVKTEVLLEQLEQHSLLSV